MQDLVHCNIHKFEPGAGHIRSIKVASKTQVFGVKFI